MTETINGAIDNGMFACGIFIDLQKAFESIWYGQSFYIVEKAWTL